MKNWILVGCLFGVTAWGQLADLKNASDGAENKWRGEQGLMVKFNPNNHVNPFVGTGGHGHTFPGAVMPFGMVSPSPETRPEGWDGCGGYHYSDSIIYGFANTHLSGVGVPDYGDLLVVPQVGKLKLTPGYQNAKKGYGYLFSHANEKATPGLYSVKLNDGIQVRLTATERVGIHEYTFDKKKGKKYIVINLDYRDQLISCSAKQEGTTKISGSRISKAWAQEQHFYFALEANVPFTKAKFIMNDKKKQHLVILEFPASTASVLLKIGISGTDEAGAKNNLAQEAGSWDFNDYMRKAANAWSEELSKIIVRGEKSYMDNFYTSLYHAFIHPSVWSDVDGRYRTFNQTIETSKTPIYSVFSIWDTYRAANPLYTLVQPERTVDFIESYRLQAKQTGLLPVWTLSNNETGCMIGYHSASVVADAIIKGLPIDNPKELLGMMVKTAKHDHLGKLDYGTHGFISAEAEAESVSKTLEYAYDDYTIAQLAKLLGDEAVYAEFTERSYNYQNVFNSETGFFQARNGGVWLDHFVPNEVNHHFTEANAWQYSIASQHHIPNLAQLHGSTQQFERHLDRLFSEQGLSGREQSDITGLIGQYAHGNEPSHHIAYAYNYCQKPWRTQQLVREILTTQYNNAPDGLSGNEDCGQMSAWYVMSAMGLYQMAPGNPSYTFGTPLFDYVSIRTGEKVFVIQANNAKENQYISSVQLNGKPLEQLYVSHKDMVNGGMLKFTCSDEPNEALAAYAIDQSLAAERPLAVPYFTVPQVVFNSSIEVGVDKLNTQPGIIYVAKDNGPFEPLKTGEKITLNESAVLKAKVVLTDGNTTKESKVVETAYKKYLPIGTLTLDKAYANQYAGDGPQTLVNGRKGTLEYRSTAWQGFNGTDVSGIIALHQETQVSKVSASVLQDTKSWIFAPSKLVVEVSLDGVKYTKFGEVKSPIAATKEGAHLVNYTVEGLPSNVKFIRFRLVNFGPCPSWHLGAGNPTWIFADEITVE